MPTWTSRRASTRISVLSFLARNARVFGKWLFYYFNYHYARIREVGGGTNQGALNCFLLKRLRLPLPKIERQKNVAAVFDSVEELEHRHRVVLSRKEQLKKSLMHDLLTGRVRVNPCQHRRPSCHERSTATSNFPSSAGSPANRRSEYANKGLGWTYRDEEAMAAFERPLEDPLVEKLLVEAILRINPEVKTEAQARLAVAALRKTMSHPDKLTANRQTLDLLARRRKGRARARARTRKRFTSSNSIQHGST